MKPLKDGDVVSLEWVMSRRNFCQATLVGAAALLVPGCGGPLPRVGTGELEDPSGDSTAPGNNPDLSVSTGENADLATRGPVDMARSPSPDLAMNGGSNACPSGVVDSGQAPSGIAVNSAVFVLAVGGFICRDSSGWFAVSNRCTHQGRPVFWLGGEFFCPSHSAHFALDGTHKSGPGSGALTHYTLCVTGKGTIGISKTAVGQAQRYQF
jgi:Rieske Fe-S protein